MDLSTGARTTLVDFGASVRATALVSDGERLFVAVGIEIRAYDPATGGMVWEEPYEAPRLSVGEPEGMICNGPAVTPEALYYPCHQVGTPNPGGVQWLTTSRPILLVLDLETGAELWTWSPAPHGADTTPDNGLKAHLVNYSPGRLAVGDGRVFLTVRGGGATSLTHTDAHGTYVGSGILYALDAATGQVFWQRALDDGTATPSEVQRPEFDPRRDPLRLRYGAGAGPAIVLTPGALYVKQMRLQALDPSTGTELWGVRLAPDDATIETGHRMAIFADRIFATAFSTLYAVDVRTHTVAWETTLPDGEDWSSVDAVVVAGGRVFSVAASGRAFAFDVDDGAILDQRPLGVASTFSVGEGVLAAIDREARVVVLGRTPAAIHLQVKVDDAYPPPGSPVRLDLGGTRAGVLHDRTEYRVDWGDGTLTSWTTATAAEHAYVTAGDRTIRVLARNGAGQEASATLPLYVGGTPPRDLNLMQQAFESENYDLTFGVLGILLAMGGGVIALYRQRRHRDRLARELGAIDDVYAATKDRPVECEAALAERKAHARGLLVDRRLDESQFAVLDRRIDELAGTLRLETIDERFPFLPVGMARTLREMLADGRIQRWEREHFLSALSLDGYLTTQQKALVRKQIEAWFARDAGDVG